MRKQLGIIASVLFLSAMTLFFTGCQNNKCDDCCPAPVCCEPCAPVCAEPCKPVCPPPCAPVCPKPCPAPCKPVCPPPCKPVCPPPCAPVCPPPCCETCPPKCACPLKPCVHGPSGECCCCEGVSVTARNPRMCMLGDQYPLEFDIHACKDVCDVTITTTLPDGVSFIKSTPEAKVNGRSLVWEIGHMDKGQCIPAKVWLKCEREGDLCTCFCVKATPVAFCALLCAKPVLVCEKCATPQVCPGEPIHYTVTVTNIGTCTAEDVVITDRLPDGVEHASGQKTLCFKLGNLEPCQSKKVNFCVTACARGKVCNSAVVTACNANQTSCEACTCVCCCAIECVKTGPKEVPVGQNAEYQIVVTNTGDLVLHDVVVTDTAPSATSIVAAAGANICGKQAVWKLREVKPGERITFNITLTTCTPGYFVNRVNVTNCEGCNACCEAGTNWKGRPALCVNACVSDNPVCVNESTTLKITVVNKGQEYDSNVVVSVALPSSLEVINGSGATTAKINGSNVEFAPFQSLAPRQTIEYFVNVKAKSAGDARAKVSVRSDFIKQPITEEESVIVN